MIERLIGDFCLKVTQCLQEVKAERLLSRWAWMDLVDKAGGSSDFENCSEGMEVFRCGRMYRNAREIARLKTLHPLQT